MIGAEATKAGVSALAGRSQEDWISRAQTSRSRGQPVRTKQPAGFEAESRVLVAGPKSPSSGYKLQSFELYRRNLYEPEVITIDELLARAEWHVQVAAEATTG